MTCAEDSNVSWHVPLLLYFIVLTCKVTYCLSVILWLYIFLHHNFLKTLAPYEQLLIVEINFKPNDKRPLLSKSHYYVPLSCATVILTSLVFNNAQWGKWDNYRSLVSSSKYRPNQIIHQIWNIKCKVEM